MIPISWILSKDWNQSESKKSNVLLWIQALSQKVMKFNKPWPKKRRRSSYSPKLEMRICSMMWHWITTKSRSILKTASFTSNFMIKDSTRSDRNTKFELTFELRRFHLKDRTLKTLKMPLARPVNLHNVLKWNTFTKMALKCSTRNSFKIDWITSEWRYSEYWTNFIVGTKLAKSSVPNKKGNERIKLRKFWLKLIDSITAFNICTQLKRRLTFFEGLNLTIISKTGRKC